VDNLRYDAATQLGLTVGFGEDEYRRERHGLMHTNERLPEEYKLGRIGTSAGDGWAEYLRESAGFEAIAAIIAKLRDRALAHDAGAQFPDGAGRTITGCLWRRTSRPPGRF